MKETARQRRRMLLLDGLCIAVIVAGAFVGDVYTLLRSFGPEGLTGFDDPVYETLLAQAAAAGSSEVRCQLLAQAERQLLAGCAAVPLFAQHKRLLLAGGVEGLVFDPYGPVLDLTWTTKQ